jgi:putative sigma-54 modulation protein
VQINVSTRHGHLSAETREKIAGKLERLFRFHERLTAVNVTVDLEHKDTPELEIRVSAERAEDFVAADRSSSLMASLDVALHKIEQQLRKHKEKLTDHRHTGRRTQVDEASPEGELSD